MDGDDVIDNRVKRGQLDGFQSFSGDSALNPNQSNKVSLDDDDVDGDDDDSDSGEESDNDMDSNLTSLSIRTCAHVSRVLCA